MLENFQYDESIKTFTSLLEEDPDNKQAYLRRAFAYFENGNLALSLKDYAKSKDQESKKNFLPVSEEFLDIFLRNVMRGIGDSAKEFVPSLCHSAYGLGHALWVFGEAPKESLERLGRASYDMFDEMKDFIQTLDKETAEEYWVECVGELRDFKERLSLLDDKQKGRMMGYLIGKYGVDIFAGFAIVKGVTKFKVLKEANRICNLEMMVGSQKGKAAGFKAAKEVHEARSSFFETVRYHAGKQEKHILGKNNYDSKKSTWTHSDPEGLVLEFAGKGKPEVGVPGEGGYRETVDFKQKIGIWKTKNGDQMLETTRGTIHYTKDGWAHIVPAHPEGKN